MRISTNSIHYPWQLVGAGLLLAWSFLTFLSGQSKVVSLVSSLPDLVYLGMTLASVVLLAVFEWRTGSLQSSDRLLFTARLGCALMCIGVISSAIFALDSSRFVPFLLVGKALSGPGQGLLWFSWGTVLVRFEIENIEHSFMLWVLTLAAAMVIPSLWGMFPGQTQGMLRLIVMVGLPLASFGFFRQALRVSTPIPRESVEACEFGAWLGEFKGVILTFVNMGAALAAIILIWSTFLFEHAIRLEEVGVIFACGSLVSFFAVWVSLRTTRRFRLNSFYRWMVPLLSVAVAFDVMLGSALLTPSFVCLTVANVCFEAMSRLYIIYTAIRNHRYAALMVSLGLVATTLAGIVGVGLWGLALLTGAYSNVHGLLVATLACFATVASLLPDGGRLQSSEEASSMRSARQGRDGSCSDSLGKSCDEVAKRYGLSKREKDVLVLLAQGRSRTYIREALFISKGTVDAHIHHIYSKMDVHSKDEVQSIVLGEGGK